MTRSEFAQLGDGEVAYIKQLDHPTLAEKLFPALSTRRGHRPIRRARRRRDAARLDRQPHRGHRQRHRERPRAGQSACTQTGSPLRCANTPHRPAPGGAMSFGLASGIAQSIFSRVISIKDEARCGRTGHPRFWIVDFPFPRPTFSDNVARRRAARWSNSPGKSSSSTPRCRPWSSTRWRRQRSR